MLARSSTHQADRDPSCLGDIQYFDSRLTKDKRRGGVFIRQLNDRVSVFNISFPHASTVPPPHARGPGDYPSCVYRSPGSGPLREITPRMLVYLSFRIMPSRRSSYNLKGLTTNAGLLGTTPTSRDPTLYKQNKQQKQTKNKQQINKTTKILK